MDLLSAKFPPLAPIIAITKYLWYSFKKVWNWYKKPKVKIEFKSHLITVEGESGKIISSFSVPSIIITPKNQELEIKIKSISVGGSYYGYLSGGFLALNGKKHNSEILNYIDQKKLYIKASKYSPLVIPLPTIGHGYESYLFMKPKESLLFFPHRKITLLFEANDKIYHYGLDIVEVSRIVINHLSYNCQGLKTINNEHKQYSI